MYPRIRGLALVLPIGFLALCIETQSLAFAAQESSGAARNLALGTWKLDVEASSYSPGPGPKSQTRTYAAHLDGIEATVLTTDASGKSQTIRYVADYDSLEYPVSGATGVSTIALERINAHTAVATLRHGRKELGSARREISEDGQTMTITFRGTNREGRPVNNLTVFKKVAR